MDKWDNITYHFVSGAAHSTISLRKVSSPRPLHPAPQPSRSPGARSNFFPQTEWYLVGYRETVRTAGTTD
ncbi:Hypothetical protein SMAX5B_020534 [Scophthalmus maximus]|uniref:Uncharacterized protein n=1 Tax=Scophthalmus maximus TaxID=52904 RepID=A0A2U9CQ77_SCOMX|nr:Hypothetical protein SMAX5B_020534 [Scophthalmus maximus]